MKLGVMDFKKSICIYTYNLDVSILKNKNNNYIYVYNNNYYCIFLIRKDIKIHMHMKYNIFLTQNKNIFILKNILKKISTFLKQFFVCKYTKIKFTGKGYKIKKNNKSNLVLLFNRAHITNLWWRNISIKKIKKYKIYIKCSNKNVKIIQNIINIRPINIFTKRGLRNTKQIVLKKKGKK